jgi:hypothetical protein
MNDNINDMSEIKFKSEDEFYAVPTQRPLFKTNERYAVVGTTQSGKTTFVREALLPMFENSGIRIVFWDGAAKNLDWKHDVRVRSPDECRRALKAGRKKILYQYRPKNVTKKNTDDMGEDFNDLCHVLYDEGNLLFYVDEASFVSTPMSIWHWYKMLIIGGAGRGLGVISAGQRPREMNNALFAQSQYIFSFPLEMRTDITKLVEGGVRDPKIYETIEALPQYHYYFYNRNIKRAEVHSPVGSERSMVDELGNVKIEKKKIDNKGNSFGNFIDSIVGEVEQAFDDILGKPGGEGEKKKEEIKPEVKEAIKEEVKKEVHKEEHKEESPTRRAPEIHISEISNPKHKEHQDMPYNSL